MITAIDSSVVLDVLTNDSLHAIPSLKALTFARGGGRLIACPVVWAEVRAFFAEETAMSAAFDRVRINFDPFDRQISELAGSMWRLYRKQGGQRSRLIPDFLVAAHAQVRGARLLTRDRGFARRYFGELEIVEP